VTIDGEVLPGTGAVNHAAAGHTDPNAAVMEVNGTLEFTSHGNDLWHS
jgi:hypothetical protein